MSYFLLYESYLNYLVKDFQSGISTLDNHLCQKINLELNISNIEQLKSEFFNIVNKTDESEYYINQLLK